MIRKLCSLVLSALLMPALSACATVREYSAEPIEAWVVDAETNQPIEDVIVVAHWVLLGGIHQQTVGELMIMETVTDKGGRFYFPAWGPKKTPRNVPFPWKAYLTTSDPAMLLFKSGYKYVGLENRLSTQAMKGLGPSLRSSDWNGKTIKMEKFKGTMKEYDRHMSFLKGSLRFIEDDCQWKMTPNMILELQQQLDTFKAAGIVTGFYSVDYFPMNKADEAKCGSVKEFFRSYRQ